ncbi:MAG: integrase, partial [Marivivens sp.]|nr:integrase [Marivivens sp.]
MTEALNFSFQSGAKIDVVALVQAMEPKPSVLSVMAAEYLELKAIQQKPTLLAVHLLKSLAGDKEVVEYSRDDARAFVRALELKGVATATIRRRIISISAILNYAYSELDIEKRNPFSRIIIRGEGKDRKKRGTFSIDQLGEGYVEALC